MSNDVILSKNAFELLSMYAFPHMRLVPDLTKQEGAEAFAELKAKGLIREGIGRAVVATFNDLQLDGTESAEEFETAMSARLEDTPGWVITEKAIAALADTVEPENKEKAVRVMRTFIADKDPK